jgi:hypothetical protein
MKKPRYILFVVFLALAGGFLFFIPGKNVFAETWSQMTWRMESHSKDFSEDDAKHTAEIYRKRLLNLGLKENVFGIFTEKTTVVVKVKNVQPHSDQYDNILRALTVEGHLAFWETFRRQEALPLLYNAFDNKTDWKKFGRMLKTSGEDTLPGSQSCPRIGFAAESDVVWINSVLDSLNTIQKLPPNMKFGWCERKDEEHKGEWELIALKAEADGKPALDKPHLLDASLVKSKYNPTPEISMVMDSAAALKWEGITYRNIGRSIAIVYDGKVVSYPTVNGGITGGRSQITGVFTIKEAAEIVSMLKTEPLPARMYPR